MVHEVVQKATECDGSEFSSYLEAKCRMKSGSIDLAEGLLVKHSMLYGMSGHHDGDNTINRLMESHFLRISSTEKKCKPTRQCDVCSKLNERRENVHYCEDCDVALCIDGCFEAYHTKKNL
jgi:hypothetical protein